VAAKPYIKEIEYSKRISVLNSKMSLSILRTRVLIGTKLCRKFILQQQGTSARSASAFVSRGFVSKNVNLKNEEGAAIQKLELLVENIYSQEEFPKISKNEAKMHIQDPENTDSQMVNDNPIVLLFGWGGANHKNLSKYSSIYLGAGFTTVQYILPTRHIFRDTAQIPEVMGNLLMQLEKVDIYERPVYVHCLSDTGIMCYQGMDVVRRRSSKMKSMDVRGVIWDSSCGPRPQITVPRVLALLVVNWFCSMRDGIGMAKSLNSSYRLLIDRARPGLIGRWQGKDMELSLIEGIWSGDFGRDHYLNFPSIPELFIYSNKDYYLPFSYLEREVLEPRKEVGANFTAVKFKGSAHVAHIRHFKEEYKEHVLSFLNLGMTHEKEDIETEKKDKETRKKSEKKMLEHNLQPKLL